ncbi:hypothetical protein, partial [Fulvivirga lutimaris]|uniref:hypothetical protein n=1 Tax=Fulvivirga lutimaris TaxID=1819566 RepID=UPI0012BBE89B
MKVNIKNIIKLGLIIGIVDILLAFVHAYLFNGVEPIRLLQYVASGIVGREAFTGGMTSAILGLLLHMFIALGWTSLFYVLYDNVQMFFKNRFPFGLSFGLFIWLMMNLVIVPLSNTPPQKAKGMLPLM